MKLKNGSSWIFQIVDANHNPRDFKPGEIIRVHQDVGLVFEVRDKGYLYLTVDKNLPDATSDDIGGDGGLASVAGGGNN